MYLLNNQVLLIFKGGFRVIIFPFFFIISKVINYLVRVKRVNLEVWYHLRVVFQVLNTMSVCIVLWIFYV